MRYPAKALFRRAALSLLLSLIVVTSQRPDTPVPSPTPTSMPTYGPASSAIVNAIMFNTLGGIVFILICYFFSGHHLYQADVDARLEKFAAARAAAAPSTSTPAESSTSERSPLLDVDKEIP
jgi:hypothetical protein